MVKYGHLIKLCLAGLVKDNVRSNDRDVLADTEDDHQEYETEPAPAHAKDHDLLSTINEVDNNSDVSSSDGNNADVFAVEPPRMLRPLQKPVFASTLEMLSMSMRTSVRDIARMHPLAEIYDNINMYWKVGKQVLGKSSTNCLPFPEFAFLTSAT
jgi:hypothetical protein